MKPISRYKLLVALTVGFLLAPSWARAYWPYHPYYGEPAYAPSYAPNGAALGPWDWNFDVGGGPTSVVGNTNNRFNDGWNFTMGGGYNFTPRSGFVFEYMESGLGLSDEELQRQQADSGDASVWGITLSPIWRFRVAGPIGGYLIGGGGFYQREERLTEQGEVFVPTFRGGFFAPGEIQVRDFDNAGGLNAGAGLTWNLGWGTKFFVEARYHYIFTGGTPTQIIPVTFGLRW